jgi:hypothetical protein
MSCKISNRLKCNVWNPKVETFGNVTALLIAETELLYVQCVPHREGDLLSQVRDNNNEQTAQRVESSSGNSTGIPELGCGAKCKTATVFKTQRVFCRSYTFEGHNSIRCSYNNPIRIPRIHFDQNHVSKTLDL